MRVMQKYCAWLGFDYNNWSLNKRFSKFKFNAYTLISRINSKCRTIFGTNNLVVDSFYYIRLCFIHVFWKIEVEVLIEYKLVL